MTPVPLKHVALEGAVQVVSSLTDRRVWVNSVPDKYVVMPTPTWSAERAALALAEWRSSFAHVGGRVGNRALLVQMAERTLSALDRDTFANAVDKLITATAGQARRPGKGRSAGRFPIVRAVEVMVLCAKHDLLLFPSGEVLRSPMLRGQSLPEAAATWYGPFRAEIMQALIRLPVMEKESGTDSVALRFLLSMGGLNSIGDIGPEIFEVLRPVVSGELYQKAKMGGRVARVDYIIDAVLQLQRERYVGDDARTALIPRDSNALRFGLEGPPPVTAGMDQQFTWILAEHPDKAAWQEAAAAYLASLKVVATGGQIGYLNMMFRSLFAGTDTPNTPLEFCHFAKRKSFTDALRNIFLATDASGAYLRTPQSIQQIVSTTERFFRLLLDTHAFHPETGAPDPSYTNPVTALRAETPNTYHKGETEKEALPDEVKAEMIEALTSPVCDPLTGRVVWTFSWAKTLTNDQLDWVNPDTKQTERIWSPARALAVLFMLHSPLRGLQVRFLGSGEGDPEVYVPHAQHPRSGKWGDMWAPTTHDVHGGDWVPNKSRWAPGPEEKPVKKQRFTGVLRRFQSSDGTHYLGTYISTNKTADKNVNPAKFGYEIPLILPVNLEIVEYLTAWQAQHNPANTPKSRTELHTVPDKGSKKMTGLYPPMHYLFRDAAADHPDEPISKPRLSTFWISLSHHVDESRKRQGKPPYGLVVTHNKADGAPASVMYSLHALRVTAVTEMAENGVPFSVIAAMCGHARWVMSAYYVKLRNEFIRDSIFNAKGRDERVRVEAGDRHWKERFQPADPLADLSLLVGASDVVIPRLQATQRALVKIMDHGFCVFGGARCHDGGPVIKEEKGRVKRGPVPGGASNCASCAWWGSGVPWIPGLLSYLNALGLDQSLAIERYEAADAEYTALVVEQQACARREEPFDFERLEKPQRAREQAAAIRIDIGNRMAPLSIMVERCNALPDKGSTGKPQLLISEEVHEILLGVIEAATLTDQALQTLKDAEVYAFDATPATLVVGRVLSHTLSQSGIPFPVLSLSSSELAAVVRQMDQLVKLRLHGKGLNAVFNDALVVDSLGLTDEFRAILSASVHRIPEQDLVPLVTRSQAQRLLGSAVPLPESVDVA